MSSTPRAASSAARSLRTYDVDFATPPIRISDAHRGLADLAQAAGFEVDFRGDHIPPVMKFVPKRFPAHVVGAEQYTVEFLTPLTGPAFTRTGRPVATRDIQEGVTAQRLRYLDLLLESPWIVSLAGLPRIPRGRRAIEVRLPHPGFLIVQKVLISGEPNRQEKRPKDMAYIYQVVSLFRYDLPSIAEEVRARMAAIPVWHKWLNRFKRLSASLFGSSRASGVTEAHSVLRAEMAGLGLDVPSPETIHAGVGLFLKWF